MRGPKPKGRVNSTWSSPFAYALGLITTDGNLSKDGRHINFTTGDYDLAETFKRCLGLETISIGRKSREHETEKKYFVVQFGDVLLYRYLLSIGLMPNKSKKLGPLEVPDEYFFDFLRGHFDGDGSIYAYFDPRWRKSYLVYLSFVSASRPHLLWLQETIHRLCAVKGAINQGGSVYQLRFAKRDTLTLISKMYYTSSLPCLRRKREKVRAILAPMGEWRNLVDSPA